VEEEPQPLEGVVGGGGQALEEHGADPLHHGPHDLLHAPEVAVDRTAGHTDLVGEELHREAARPLGREQPRRHLDDLCLPLRHRLSVHGLPFATDDHGK
jgi:hypothetical protein